MEKTIFTCKKRNHQIDNEICLARQNKGICKCPKGKEIQAAVKISRTRTRKPKKEEI